MPASPKQYLDGVHSLHVLYRRNRTNHEHRPRVIYFDIKKIAIRYHYSFLRSCNLHQFITQHVSNVYLKRKSEEVIDQIEGAVRASDAWKATVLLDLTADYKPLLVVS